MEWTEVPLSNQINLNTNISKVEDFPVLGEKTNATRKTEKTFRRASSALSSVSTTSIGACNKTSAEVTWKLGCGSYYNRTEIYVRPFLSCWCQFCQENSRNPARPDYLKEEDWERCQKKRYLEPGYICEVTDSKVVRHKTLEGVQKFSVAYVKMENGVRGWVRSKNLKRRGKIRSESVLRNLAFEKRQVEVDRSRSPSVCSSSNSMLPPPLFQFGEVVLCRIKSGEWVKGEVHCEHPLKIMTAGNNRPCRFSFKNVKKHPVRKFVVLENIDVRTVAANDSWGSKATLKRGTNIDVAYVKGFEGRITAPVCGWITMRNSHSLNVVEKDYAFTSRLPTMLISNIPGSMTQRQLQIMLQQNAFVNPCSIEFQQKGDQYRAAVQFRTHAEGVELVKLGEVQLDGDRRLGFSWEMNYLRSRSMANFGTTL